MNRTLQITGLFVLLIALRAQQSVSTLDGRVVDFTGTRIEGAQLILIDAAGRTVDQQSTDASGRFSFSSITPGKFRLNVAAPGFHRESRTVVFGTGDVLHLEIGLFVAPIGDPPKIRIEGIVRSPEGKSISGATVTARPTWNSRFAIRATTDHAGRYSVLLTLPGQYEIHARAPDARSAVVVVRFLNPWKSQTVDITIDNQTIDIP